MRNAFILGATIGGALGAVVLIGYAAAGWWVCTSLTDCPAHWLPYLVVYVVGVIGISLASGGIAAGLRFLYRTTRVDVDGDARPSGDGGASGSTAEHDGGPQASAEASTDAAASAEEHHT